MTLMVPRFLLCPAPTEFLQNTLTLMEVHHPLLQAHLGLHQTHMVFHLRPLQQAPTRRLIIPALMAPLKLLMVERHPFSTHLFLPHKPPPLHRILMVLQLKAAMGLPHQVPLSLLVLTLSQPHRCLLETHFQSR